MQRRTDKAKSGSDLVFFLSASILLIIGQIVKFDGSQAFSIWCFGVFVLATRHLYMLLLRRQFAVGSLFGFLYYGVFIVWLVNFVFDVPMTSWRSTESYTFIYNSIGLLVGYINYFCLLSEALLCQQPVAKVGTFKAIPTSANGFILSISALFSLMLVVFVGFQSRDQYLLDADISSMFLVLATATVLCVLFAFSLFFMKHGLVRRQNIALISFTVLLVGANGFRFLFVMLGLITLFYVLSNKRIKARTAIISLGMGAFSYFLLLIIAYTRNEAFTTSELFNYLLKLDFNDAFGYVGAQNQADAISLGYYYHRNDLLMGLTYFDAFLRLPPNAIHTALFTTIRPQDYIVETASFLPNRFRDNNWTMGSNLFVEAVINFGRYGPYIMTTVFLIALTYFERIARRSIPLYLGYIVVSSLGFSLAWYGFSNFLKQGMFAIASSYIVWWLIRFSQSQAKFNSRIEIKIC